MSSPTDLAMLVLAMSTVVLLRVGVARSARLAGREESSATRRNLSVSFGVGALWSGSSPCSRRAACSPTGPRVPRAGASCR